MAKTTAPLLSFDARGQIAQTQVYASWKGRRYVRRYTVPSNPRSTGQVMTRDVFTWLQQVFKFAPGIFQSIWFEYAEGKVMTGYNAFTKFNLGPLRTESDLANFIFSPSTRSGVAPASVSAVGGVGTIDITVVPPSPVPTGWFVSACEGFAILDQDPHSGTDYRIYGGQDSTDPYVINLTGLDAGDYIAAGIVVWTRPDGKAASSAALTDPVTVT